MRCASWMVVTVLPMLSAVAFGAEPTKTLQVGEKPESVCRGFDGKLYVTLINGETPGDGAIAKVDGDEVSIFAKGLNAPKGIAFVGGQLVVADEQTMYKIDAQGEVTKLVSADDFPAPIEFLNDVAASKDGQSVYVSEMSSPAPMFDPDGDRRLWGLDSDAAKTLPNKGCVYRVTLDGKVTVAVPAGQPLMKFPNGVFAGGSKEDERVFVGEFFTGDILRYDGSKYIKLATGPRGLDGLASTKDFFFASSWTDGTVWQIHRKTKESTELVSGLKSAADFYLDVKNGQLIVPDMLAGTLLFYALPATETAAETSP
jgi:hypothetical protein